MQNLISSLERVAVRITRMISGSRDFSNWNSDAQKCYVYVAKLIAALTTKQINSNLEAKNLIKRSLEDSGDRPMSKYRRVLDEAINLTSTNRGFRTINHMLAAYEQTKKGFICFYPKRQVQDDGIHAKPINL